MKLTYVGDLGHLSVVSQLAHHLIKDHPEKLTHVHRATAQRHGMIAVYGELKLYAWGTQGHIRIEEICE